MSRILIRSQCGISIAMFAFSLCVANSVSAVDITGTVHFQGSVVFSAPISGISAQDLEVALKSETESTGNGEKCSVLSVTSDNPDAGGLYPDAGDVTAQIEIKRGGPQTPSGDCIVTVRATGTDGVSVSARGSRTIFVNAADIAANATVAVPDITVRQSKALAGLDRECFKWVKKQIKKRAKCNFLLLKNGVDGADRCKDAGIEPASCDPGNHVEAILALSHGANDQQTNPGTAEGVDYLVLKDQVTCQKLFGKAAFTFAIKRLKLVDRLCIATASDDESCRDTQSNASKPKLDKIDKCLVDQMTDGGTGRVVPVVDPPCDACIVGGVIDRKCLKGCFQIAVGELTDGILGDLPVCGNGIKQSGESCDDGNLTDGDCCSSTCTAENLGNQTCGVGACETTVAVCQNGAPVTCIPGTPGTEGPIGDATCSDAIDNDCDTFTDAADTDCQ